MYTAERRRDQTIRAQDYLNDKLQTTEDLQKLGELLDIVQDKAAVLQRQHAEASKALDEARVASEDHSTNTAKRVAAFKKQQVEVDRRLRILTRSDATDEAVLKFDGIMAKLKRLEIAQNYVGLLREAEALSTEARRNFKASPQAALKPYLRLKGLASALGAAQPAAEDAAPHLIDHVSQMAVGLWEQMKDAFAQDFERTLTKLEWPRRDIILEGALEQEWVSGVERLLELQAPELNSHEAPAPTSSNAGDQVVLLPLEIMVRPLRLRFQYHFQGDRATNKLDKPEFFFSHVLDLMSVYDEFLARFLEPVLRRHFRSSDLALDPAYVDSSFAWITALLPMLRHKISAMLPQVSKEPQLFSHLIYEIMSFDKIIVDEWGYNAGSGAERWRGLTWETLVKKGWFGQWLTIEKDFALSRYRNIVTAGALEIDYDSLDPGSTKPTTAAVRVNDLLEAITDRYRLLGSVQQQLRFLVDIQLNIFDLFFNHLRSSLETYLTMTSSITRTVSKEGVEKFEGLGGLEYLCQVYGSAEFLERKLQDWNDNVFFIDLWDDLQARARGKSHQNGKVADDMTVADVAEHTPPGLGSGQESGALFDETSGAYRRLRTRAEEVMQEKLAYDMRESLRPYGKLSYWASVAPESTNMVSSPELSRPLDLLDSYLGFLSRALAKVPLRRITRQLCLSLQSFLWGMLSRNNFSTTGITQFKCDISALWVTIDRHAGYGQGEIGMRKLHQAIEILGLPIEPGQRSEEGRGEDFVDQLGAREVEARLFKDNESAKQVLEELGIETLTEGEARNLLEKRIELAN